MDQDEPWWHESGSQRADEGDGPTGRDSGNRGSSPLGSGPEEAARLFTTIRDRVLSDPAAMKAGIQAMEMFTSLRGAIQNPVAPGDAPECAYCPVCQAISRAQNISPESVETVTAAAIQFAETLRNALGDEDGEPETTVRHVPLDDDPDEGSPDTDPKEGAPDDGSKEE